MDINSIDYHVDVLRNFAKKIESFDLHNASNRDVSDIMKEFDTISYQIHRYKEFELRTIGLTTPEDFERHARELRHLARQKAYVEEIEETLLEEVSSKVEKIFKEHCFQIMACDEKYFDVVYGEAYNRGHSCGYEEVLNYVESVSNFVAMVLAVK
jgi:hypothetical protein